MDPPKKKRRGPYGKDNKPTSTDDSKGLENFNVHDAVDNVNVACIGEDANYSAQINNIANDACIVTESDMQRLMDLNSDSSDAESGDGEDLPKTSAKEKESDTFEAENNTATLTNFLRETTKNPCIEMTNNDEMNDECDSLPDSVDGLDMADDLNDDFDYIDDILDTVTQDEYSDEDKQSLYDGCSVTLGAFMLLLAIFCTKYNLIGEAIQQLLNIIALILPQGHRLCTSLHAYKMFFKTLRNPLIHHYYCKHCIGYIDDKKVKYCPYEQCKKPFDAKEKTYFLEIPIINQLKNLMAQDGFFSSLQWRFNRNAPEGTYEDIYDGKLYKSYVIDGGPLSYPENVSFTFNTDGAPVFKSSNISLWPIYLVINELPYKMRMKKENMILAALWFGNKKPTMGTFLKPFLRSMDELNNGTECISPEMGRFICKGYLFCGTADLPARCLLCNSIQYNGTFSCWKCKQKGESVKVGKGHTMVYSFNLDLPKGPERTVLSVLEDARTSVEKKIAGNKDSTTNGIKGPSWLMLFPKFNIRLSKIKPTLDISRLPRSIETDLKYWKASEYRSFLLFYGTIILQGILDNEKYCHYVLLVNAMHILLKCGSKDCELDTAEKMLFSFCQHFSRLYDKCYMTLNLHQLVHFPDSVRYLGPLYTHSCFSFEDKNGAILKMIKGTQCIDSQITTGTGTEGKMHSKRFCGRKNIQFY